MPTPSWDDLGAFLSLDDFAVLAFSKRHGESFPVILEEQTMSRELGTYDLNAPDPTVTAKEADIKGMRKRDSLVIAGKTYWLVHDPQPDGTGMALLRMSRTEDDT